MIPKECKRIIEVDFPIAVVSKHSAREKSIRHGHPSTLHLWWARRPLAACRAVLLGLLLPDPCDLHCPEEFKPKAREALRGVTNPGTTDEDLRRGILRFIGDFANWDNSSHPTYLRAGRELVRAAHPEETPLVVDPFAGGGSIPLEALRLGCEAFASDLNPVACLILKVMLEDIPRYGNADFRLNDDNGKEIVVHGLADALRHVGGQIKRATEVELAEFYPPDPDGARPIAYLWARTVKCESPNCGAEIPLMRSFWLCKKANRRRALRPIVHHGGTEGTEKGGEGLEAEQVCFEVFEPKNEKEVHDGTVTRAKATCLCCGAVLPPERVRAQLAEQRGGADTAFDAKGNRIGGARMLAVVTLRPEEPGRHYRLPTERDYQAVWKAQKRLKKIVTEWESLPADRRGLCPVPDEPLPPIGTLGFRVQRYGMLRWGDLFTARQEATHAWVTRLIGDIPDVHVREAMALCHGHVITRNSSLCVWRYQADQEKVESVFSRQALPVVWDFGEAIPVSTSTGSVSDSTDVVVRMIEQAMSLGERQGQVSQADACESPLPDESSAVLFTDPPYYDAIPYSDLSDFFLVWFKRALPEHAGLHDPFEPAIEPGKSNVVGAHRRIGRPVARTKPCNKSWRSRATW